MRFVPLALLICPCMAARAAPADLPPAVVAAPTSLGSSLRGEVPALQVSIGQRARLFYEPKLEPRPAPWEPLPRADPEHRLGLEFKGAGASSAPRNLLRVQLSATSALHLRPRGGGLAMSWRSQF